MTNKDTQYVPNFLNMRWYPLALFISLIYIKCLICYSLPMKTIMCDICNKICRRKAGLNKLANEDDLKVYIIKTAEKIIENGGVH